MKSKRSIESIISAPSRFDGDEYHYYRPTGDSAVGEPDVLLDHVDVLMRAINDGLPTADEACARLAGLFAMDNVKMKNSLSNCKGIADG